MQNIYTSRITVGKLQNPDLKISLAIGGWTHGVEKFTQLVDNTADMNTFAGNVITYLRNINFDGLDLDWEYPAHRGSPAASFSNSLLKI
jgi:chitinase